MRITGGCFRGRRIQVPGGEVRPTSERVREAIFSSLADRVPGARVLDLYAGSGALGLEAWSRGARETVLVEQHPAVWRVLKKNMEALRTDEPEGRVECVRMEGLRFLSKPGPMFDLIFADPPYDQGLFDKTIAALEQGTRLAPEGWLVFEMRARPVIPVPAGWQSIKDKIYGGTRVLYLRRDSVDG